MSEAKGPRQLREVLLERGVTVSADELEELRSMYPALLDWIAVVEDLGSGAPASPSALPTP